MSDLHLVQFDPTKNYHRIKEFECGNPMIDRFVQKSLKKRVKNHLSQAYALLDSENGDRFVGFYTLDTFAISRDTFETSVKGLPPVVPVLKLGMLGVDKSYQHQGIGKRLLRDAFLKTVEVSRLAGCVGLYLLAEHEAIPFYKRLGFVALKEEDPLPMFLKIETILEVCG